MHDPITEELFRNAIVALGDEMALTIYRAAYSGVLKNIMDYSTAICDPFPARCNPACGISATISPRAIS
jgi:N-methylhydantoinase B/oxoprolinase/acetone carboxylase alpha subunit